MFSWDWSYKNILFVRLANVYLRLDLGMKRLNLKYCCKVIFLVILDTSFPKCWTISSTLIFSTFTTCKWWSWNVIWTTVFLFSKSLLITGSSRFLECMFISCRRFHTLCVFYPIWQQWPILPAVGLPSCPVTLHSHDNTQCFDECKIIVSEKSLFHYLGVYTTYNSIS